MNQENKRDLYSSLFIVVVVTVSTFGGFFIGRVYSESPQPVMPEGGNYVQCVEDASVRKASCYLGAIYEKTIEVEGRKFDIFDGEPERHGEYGIYYVKKFTP